MQVFCQGHIPVRRDFLEAEVRKRILAHPHGAPGISEGRPTGDGQVEYVCRDDRGHPVGVMGMTGGYITDFCTLKGFRRLGIATRLLKHALKAHNITAIRGPFTSDGQAFVDAIKIG